MAPETLPLTVLDEVFLNLDDTVTWSVQFEVRVSGRFDVDRLRDALRAALARHPMGRAELVGGSWNDRRRHWRIADEPAPVELPVQLCERPGDLDELRARLYDDAPDLTRAPLLRAAVARDGESDVLLLNLHHVAFDGMSAVRLMTSIARGYAGEADEVTGPPLDEARDLRRIAGSHSLGQQISRAVGLAGDVVERRAPIARISGSGGGSDRHRFGVTTLRLDAAETAAAIARRPEGTTVNDLLITALLLTVRRWNAAHSEDGGERVTAMMPVNLRPRDWSGEVLSNFASYLVIGLSADEPDDLGAATGTVARRTRYYKEQRAAGWIVDLLTPGNLLPVGVKEQLQKLLPLVEDRFMESTVLSNLGRIGPLGFGDAGEVTEVWFSPPSCAPLHVAVGVATVGDALHVTLRHVTEVLDAKAAAEFADLLREVLLRN